jgi:hypothetical protein
MSKEKEGSITVSQIKKGSQESSVKFSAQKKGTMLVETIHHKKKVERLQRKERAPVPGPKQLGKKRVPAGT